MAYFTDQAKDAGCVTCPGCDKPFREGDDVINAVGRVYVHSDCIGEFVWERN